MTLTFSNSPLWSKCAQSCKPRAGVHYEREETDDIKEGRAAHWLANHVLRGDASGAEEGLGETAPNGWIIDEKMVRHIQEFVDIVRRHGGVMDATPLTLWGLVHGVPDTYSVGGDTLRVYELKYGYRLVEPDTPQLILAAGALCTHEHKLVSLEIFQPRPYHPSGKHRKWVISPQELQDHLADLEKAAWATTEQWPRATPGVHCKRHYCPQAAFCTELTSEIGAAYEIVAGTRRAGKPTVGELGAEVDFLQIADEMIGARLKAAEAELEARIRTGEDGGDWYLKQRQTKRDWTVPLAMVAVLTGKDPYQKPKPKSPAMMEDEGVPLEVIKSISKPGNGGLELAKLDKRAVARMFGEPLKEGQ
jgi:hypothetical protein